MTIGKRALEPSSRPAEWRSGGSKNFEGGGDDLGLSAPFSFISNAPNEIYAFHMENRLY